MKVFNPAEAAIATTPQTLDRALRMLVELSRRRNMGWRLTDLARECNLDLATASRMLAGLAAHGLAARRDSDRHFIVGPQLLNLGLAAQYHVDVVRVAEAITESVAAELRLVAFVFMLSGHDFVCVARAGRGRTKALGIEVGTRRPLLRSAGGVAILQVLPAAVRKAAIAENRRRITRAHDERLVAIERMLLRSQRLSYAINRDDVVPGITAIGVGVALPVPWIAASVLVAGPSDELGDRVVEGARKVLERASRRLHDACVVPG